MTSNGQQMVSICFWWYMWLIKSFWDRKKWNFLLDVVKKHGWFYGNLSNSRRVWPSFNRRRGRLKFRILKNFKRSTLLTANWEEHVYILARTTKIMIGIPIFVVSGWDKGQNITGFSQLCGDFLIDINHLFYGRSHCEWPNISLSWIW